MQVVGSVRLQIAYISISLVISYTSVCAIDYTKQ